MGLFRKAYANLSAGMDAVLITHDVKRAANEAGLSLGLVQIFVPQGCSGLALLENDPSLLQNFKKWIESQVPATAEKRPDRKSGSGRDYAHMRAQILGQSLSIPFAEGKLQLGPWQEVFLFDFDDKVVRREYFILVTGEAPSAKQ